jgi:hypothetical protein
MITAYCQKGFGGTVNKNCMVFQNQLNCCEGRKLDKMMMMMMMIQFFIANVLAQQS